MITTLGHVAAAWIGATRCLGERAIGLGGTEGAVALRALTGPLRADALHRQTALEAALRDAVALQHRMLREVAAMPTTFAMEFTGQLAALQAAERAPGAAQGGPGHRAA
ncbi:MAG: hypothetical protein K2X74_19960, partial [Acetobacteraceae bacterium]|nr:hypothetical protein [Acetobacteraceae bacterium]